MELGCASHVSSKKIHGPRNCTGIGRTEIVIVGREDSDALTTRPCTNQSERVGSSLPAGRRQSCRLFTGRSRGSRQTEVGVGKFTSAAELKLRPANGNRTAERSSQKAHDWISCCGSLGCVRRTRL